MSRYALMRRGMESEQRRRLRHLLTNLDALWSGSRDYVVSLDLPVAIENDLIREYTPDRPPTTDDFRKAWEEDAKTVEQLSLNIPSRSRNPHS